jgi:hypothetical protein
MTIIAIGIMCKDINIIFLIQHLFGITWISWMLVAHSKQRKIYEHHHYSVDVVAKLCTHHST